MTLRPLPARDRIEDLGNGVWLTVLTRSTDPALERFFAAYDTESEVFEKMSQLRGIGRRNDYIERLISNMESQTRDREARISKGDENATSLMLGALGLFGFFQLTFQWSTTLSPQAGVVSAEPSLSWAPPFVQLPGLDWSNASDMIAGARFYLSAAFTAALLGYLVWRLIRGSRP